MLLASINWTNVLVVSVPATGSFLAAVLSYLNRRNLRTPSGDSIGAVVERTHDLTAVQTLALGVEASKTMPDSARRLNADPASPVKVNGDDLAHEPEESA